jgi:hypothetical protein
MPGQFHSSHATSASRASPRRSQMPNFGPLTGEVVYDEDNQRAGLPNRPAKFASLNL